MNERKVKVLIAEDEPAATKMLRTVIEMKCPNCIIVACAIHGQQALELIEQLLPDVVLTDIKMPIMDGLAVAKKIHESYPYIHTIIVSGFQEFEFAKQAMKYGVEDYLLKPINSGQLQMLLNNIEIQLREEYKGNRQKILEALMDKQPIDAFYRKKYIDESEVYGALIRYNSLPHNYFQREASGEVQEELQQTLEKVFDSSQYIITKGRDFREHIIIQTDSAITFKTWENSFKTLEENPKTGFITMVLYKKTLKLIELRNIYPMLFKIMDQNLVIGKSQCLMITTKEELEKGKISDIVLDITFQKKISYDVVNSEWEQLKTDIIKQFAKWEKEAKPQLWVEFQVKQLLASIYDNVECTNSENVNYNNMLEEAFTYSQTFGELMKSFWDIIEKMIAYAPYKLSKIDSSEFFESVIDYIERNISMGISLQSVCNFFGISQSYMSRLFRKYKEMSFNEYINFVRIHKAKVIMAENSNLAIKAIAECVGYTDPFYFSKVFKNLTGMTPSEYMLKK